MFHNARLAAVIKMSRFNIRQRWILCWFVLLALICVMTASAQDATNSLVDYVMSHEGNAEDGRHLLLEDPRLICLRCHTVDRTGGKAGPDLSAIGDKFSRADLVRAILEPSANIAVGYGTTVVTTKDGEDHQGVLKQATGDWIEIMGGDGVPVRISTADIKAQHSSDISLMPAGLVNALKPEEFADLIAYLHSLHLSTSGVHSMAMPENIQAAAHGVALVPFFSPTVHLTQPTWFGEVPGFTNLFAVLEHSGHSWLIERTASGDRRTPLIDLSHEVRYGPATGLLGMAFHPRFSENHKYYLKYQVLRDQRIVTVLVERKFAVDFRSDSGEPGREVLAIEGATQDHNGGCIAFGPDGYLYLGMGDTGPQRDPQGHSQNLSILQGKMLRIDVDHRDAGLEYAIPRDNPFVTRSNVRPEIWAYGFREPWRFSFDRLTGELWVGDVGQDQYEEVSMPRAGENQGWNVFESVVPFSNQYRRDGENYSMPVFAYSHHVGVSITGGYVYRGHKAPEMFGHYVCADFQTCRIWELTQTNRILNNVLEIGVAPSRVTSFSQDHEGELYIVGYDSGQIYWLDLAQVKPYPHQSKVLAETSEAAPVLWRYSLQSPAGGWQGRDFDDSSWSMAPGGFGTAGTPGAVVRTDWHTSDIWLRRDFSLGSIDSNHLMLRLYHDEDAEVYLNGVEIARVPHWTQNYTDIALPAEAGSALHPGRNCLAVHCHQTGGGQYIDAGLSEYIDQ